MSTAIPALSALGVPERERRETAVFSTHRGSIRTLSTKHYEKTQQEEFAFPGCLCYDSIVCDEKIAFPLLWAGMMWRRTGKLFSEYSVPGRLNAA